MTNQLKDITIRQSAEADLVAVFALLKEFALFQKTPEKLVITAAQMQQDKDLFRCFVAETTDNIIVGFVTFFPAYYSWSGKAVYVDDLYVKEAYRALGLGKKLLDSVISLAKESGCKKVRWQVSHWNTTAIDFYKKMGAVIDDTESNCDLIL